MLVKMKKLIDVEEGEERKEREVYVRTKGRREWRVERNRKMGREGRRGVERGRGFKDRSKEENERSVESNRVMDEQSTDERRRRK